MEQKPLVSVLMGTYNTEETMLDASVMSILNQTYKNIELIIVDDHSTIYDISEVMAKYEDDRIKLIKNNQNHGLAYSLNKAISHARGKYLARMDADDICVRTRIADQVEYMRRHPKIKMVYSRAIVFGVSKYLRCDLLNNMSYRKALFLFKNGITHPTVMFDTDFMKSNDIKYDETFKKSQDYELWPRIQEYGDVIKEIPKIGLYYRTSSTQASAAGKNQDQRSFADRVRTRELLKIGLVPNEVEYSCHHSLAIGEISEDLSVNDINKWCKRIIDANNVANKHTRLYINIVLADQYLALKETRLKDAYRLFGNAVFVLSVLKIKRKVLDLYYTKTANIPCC